MLKINESFYHLQGKDLFVHKNHSHNEIEFIHVISGNGLVLKNDKTFLLESQHLYVIDARNAHIVYPQPENCIDYIRNKIVIDADSFEEFYKSIGLEEITEKLFDINPISTIHNPEIDRMYNTISKLCSSEEAGNIGFAHGYMTELIHWIYSNCKVEKKAGRKTTLQKVLNIINEKDGVTSLSEISSILFMDKFYLCHLFKQETGITLSEYLSEKKFKKCCMLLRKTSHSIEEIALLCGFSSTAALTRFFKGKADITPTRYRKNQQNSISMIL